LAACRAYSIPKSLTLRIYPELYALSFVRERLLPAIGDPDVEAEKRLTGTRR
jgi:hypothetical protein